MTRRRVIQEVMALRRGILKGAMLMRFLNIIILAVVITFSTVTDAAFLQQTSSLQKHHHSSCKHAFVLSSSNINSNSPAGENDDTVLLQRTAAHLEKLQRQQQATTRRRRNDDDDDANGKKTTRNDSVLMDDSTAADDKLLLDPLGQERERMYQTYIVQPANALKQQLQQRNLLTTGRKPDLARRLTQHDLQCIYGNVKVGKEEEDDEEEEIPGDLMSAGTAVGSSTSEIANASIIAKTRSFAGLKQLSETACVALTRAGFIQPTAIQSAAIPVIASGNSNCILHAATGSGKTLAYLLPITERLWKQNHDDDSVALILTPTRELAAQVAGIATVLAPPGTVRFVSRPSNLAAKIGYRESNDGDDDESLDMNMRTPRILIGSAKAIQQSLYGGPQFPVAPTPKPQAMGILQSTQWLVLDEVDRLLLGSTTTGKSSKRHEKPAAILTAAATRLTLGRCAVVAASATTGRPLRRELARVMGLPPQECPRVIVCNNNNNTDDDSEQRQSTTKSTTNRAVTIPDTVQHYVVPVKDGSSPGKILTTAYSVIQSLNSNNRRILLVLTRNFGISTQNVIGALKHFRCQPTPISLLDALEGSSSSNMIAAHRQVSGASGVGESSATAAAAAAVASDDNDKSSFSADAGGYLLVTGEDTVRGLHLDGLDIVLVAGRPHGPDEYTHIAGRTGRAGKSGKAVNVVSDVDADKLVSWENMLNIQFERLDGSRKKEIEVALRD